MGTITKTLFFAFLVVSVFCFGFPNDRFLNSAFAYVTDLPTSLARDVLSESVPTAFAAFDLDTNDYRIEWITDRPDGITAQLVQGSLQWVRVADVLTLPRARLHLEIKGAQSGRVSNAGFTQPLAQQEAELPVALISGDQNPIDLVFTRDGKEVHARLSLQYNPTSKPDSARVYFDPSCSRFNMHFNANEKQASTTGWIYVGCRFTELVGTPDKASSLEALIFWDGIGQTLTLGETPTPATSVSVWPLRLRSEPGSVTIKAADSSEIKIEYSMAKVYRRGSLGLGIGPYTDHFSGNGELLDTVAPVLTLYGSYFITESMRLVAFGASTIDPHLTTDFGIYMHSEYLKFIDRRVVISLLLGMHAVGFRSQGNYYVIPGFPQGFELGFIDAFKKGYNFMSGMFIYPESDGKSYYNLWVRWGSSRMFGEFNYIAWSEKIDHQPVSAKNFGLSVGFPIARFF